MDYLIRNLPQMPADFWAVLSEMAPYLLLGFIVAGMLSVLISPELVERHLGGRGVWPSIKAAAFGVPLPLCSCGVIPVSASLRRHGASRGATTAFLISTPQTGADSILVTYSLLGGVFAVFRPVVALVSGIAGGLAVELTEKRGKPANAETPAPPANAQGQKRGKDARGNGREAGPPAGRIRAALGHAFVTLPGDIANSLLVGLVIAAAISSLVPQDYFAGILGGGIVAMLIMMLVGIPVYVCASASVPIAAVLVAKGVSPGAVFAFLVTGPATNAATILTVWKLMGGRTTAVYLATIAGSALGGGLLLDLLLNPATMPMVHADHHMHAAGGWMIFKTLCAVFLMGLLVAAIVRRRLKGKVAAVPADEGETPPPSAQGLELIITGMTCAHCAQAVQQALLEVPGVESAQVDLKTGRASVSGHDIAYNSLFEAVAGLGYRAQMAIKEGGATR